ncbi:MAG: L-asparaginase, partial [Bacteroidales bacterium]|nr:L-asparaginase [Bacteroidales bacterium]
MRGGIPFFSRNTLTKNTYCSDFNINTLPKELPRVEIVNSYVGADEMALKAAVAAGAKGVVISGVGHGNSTDALRLYAAQIANGPNPVAVVRSTRVLKGGVTTELEDSFEGEIPSWYKSPQKARILLMLALTKTQDPEKIKEYFVEY